MIMSQMVTEDFDYDERGSGPTVVLVPGSCSTGAAWRPAIAALGGGFRCVTTSLLGYGGTAERRPADDPSIAHEASAVERVVDRAGSPVHLVGHSFGALVAVAVALRGNVALASLVVLEAPAVMLLRNDPDDEPYDQAFRRMTNRYFGDFAAGKADAIKGMIDFYGGDGTFASWPDRVRAYAIQTTAVNILDWATAFNFSLPPDKLGAIGVPALVAWGGNSHPAMQRANALLAGSLPNSTTAMIAGAAHFMTATHPDEVARLIGSHVLRTESLRKSRP